jgi:hypothetical protein
MSIKITVGALGAQTRNIGFLQNGLTPLKYAFFSPPEKFMLGRQESLTLPVYIRKQSIYNFYVD